MSVHEIAQSDQQKISRTEYSARNTTVAMIARVIAIVLGYCTRIVFTHTLSEDHLGINGLFTDILNILALSELGIGTAITYALYKPISEKNLEKQKSLMLMYRNFYRIVAAIIGIGGLMVIPFMDILIKNDPKVDYLILIYLMYLANSVISYLLIYKKTLIDAHQLSYIGVLYQTFFLIIQNVIQMIVLVTTHNFLLFVSILLLCTLCNNISISRKADKLYPYLREKNVKPLAKEEKKGIYQNIRAMLMHKVGDVVINNTDNVLLSSLVGIVSVGLYSNYYLVIGSVRQVLNQAFQGITASVGNLGVEESKEEVGKIFNVAFFVGQWLFGFAVICLFELLNPFVELSFGGQYVFGADVVLILCLNFYFTGMRQATLVFRDSLGLFWYDRYKSVASAIINLVSSLILGIHMGIVGIFLGTLISTLTTSMWVEPYMLYKYHLKTPVRTYFIKYSIYVAVTAGIWYVTDVLCRQISGGTLRQFVLRLMVCLVIPNVLYLVFYCRTQEFRFFLDKMLGILKHRKLTDTETQKTYTTEEQTLLQLTNAAIHNDTIPMNENIQVLDYDVLITKAERHGVLPLLYENLMQIPILSDEQRTRVNTLSLQTVRQQYRLLFLSKYLIDLFEENKIEVILLKGVGIGSYYPVPELRKSGDVDLLLTNPDELSRVQAIMEANGFYVLDEQLSLHHLAFGSSEGIEIEVHTMLAEPFDNRKTNDYLDKLLRTCSGQIVRREIMGIELPVLAPAFFGFELLLHMLQHLLRAGFGLKLLCDWVVFWEQEHGEHTHKQYLELVETAGLKEFSDMITQACVQNLGLSEDKITWMCCEQYQSQEFMRETLESEAFGRTNAERMVILRGTGIWAYVREFHHQTQLNYPKAAKCILLWPVIWILTFIRFLHNNRKIRKTSARRIFREAARRSHILEEIKFFKR